jgi:hypothetical protein
MKAFNATKKTGIVMIMYRTDYRYNLEYRGKVRSQMLSLAKKMLAGQIGIIAAARELRTFQCEVEPEIAAILNVFVVIDSETDSLPVGEVRQLWNSQALEREDRKIADAEHLYRKVATEAGASLIRLLDDLPSH